MNSHTSQHYAIDMAYIVTPEKDEPHKMFTRRLYGTLHTMAMAGRGGLEMRVMQSRATISSHAYGKTSVTPG